MKRKTAIKKTVRKSKWQLGWERTVKKVRQALQVAAWMAIGAIIILVFWK